MPQNLINKSLMLNNLTHNFVSKHSANIDKKASVAAVHNKHIPLSKSKLLREAKTCAANALVRWQELSLVNLSCEFDTWYGHHLRHIYLSNSIYLYIQKSYVEQLALTQAFRLTVLKRSVWRR